MYMIQYIDFLSRLTILFLRKQPLRACPKNRYLQNLGNFFVKHLGIMSYILQQTCKLKAYGCYKSGPFIDIFLKNAYILSKLAIIMV